MREGSEEAEGIRLLCLQLSQAAHADVPPPSTVREGGSTPTEQRCSFLDLTLALAGGLDTDCIKLLFTTAKGAMQVCPHIFA